MTEERTEERIEEKEAVVEQPKHAKAGASKSKMFLECPASLYMGSKCPEPPESKYAAEGTLAHDLAESVASDLFFKDMPLYHALARQKAKFADSDMEEYVLDYVIFLQKLAAMRSPEVIAIEEKVVLDKSLEMYGTCDFYMVYRTATGRLAIHVIDFKYGAGVKVSPEDNPQLAYYALAAIKHFEKTSDEEIFKTEVGIYQPRVESFEGPYSGVRYNRTELAKWEKKLIGGATKALNILKTGEGVETNPSEDTCRWCNGKAICKSYLDMIRGDAAVDFMPPAHKVETTLPDVHSLTAEQVTKLVLNKSIIEGFLKDVQEYAKAELFSGQETKLSLFLQATKKEKRAYRSDMPHEEIVEYLRAQGVDEPVETKESLVSIGKIEKQLAGTKAEKTEIMSQITERVPHYVKIEAVDENYDDLIESEPSEVTTPGDDFLMGETNGESDESESADPTGIAELFA